VVLAPGLAPGLGVAVPSANAAVALAPATAVAATRAPNAVRRRRARVRGVFGTGFLQSSGVSPRSRPLDPVDLKST
jgi:hypothetical protein